jgi:hypothetical protein
VPLGHNCHSPDIQRSVNNTRRQRMFSSGTAAWVGHWSLGKCLGSLVLRPFWARMLRHGTHGSWRHAQVSVVLDGAAAPQAMVALTSFCGPGGSFLHRVFVVQEAHSYIEKGGVADRRLKESQRYLMLIPSKRQILRDPPKKGKGKVCCRQMMSCATSLATPSSGRSC